jgi:hypothetical protein
MSGEMYGTTTIRVVVVSIKANYLVNELEHV